MLALLALLLAACTPSSLDLPLFICLTPNFTEGQCVTTCFEVAKHVQADEQFVFLYR